MELPLRRQDAMTTAQLMLDVRLSARLPRIARLARRLLGTAIGVACITGCAQTPKMVPPQTLVAPYDTARGEVLWAVVPLRNESATSHADAEMISDQIVAAVEETRGLRALPLNRTIETMRALKMSGVNSPADAKKLAQALGVDGLVIGSVTDYEPYEPTLGLSLALFARPGAMQTVSKEALDVRKLAAQPADSAPKNGAFQDSPVSVFTIHLDGKNHQVLMDVKAYAEGRSDPNSALNWRRYTASMELYSQFAANHAVGGLLEQEWMRLARLGTAQAQVDHKDH